MEDLAAAAARYTEDARNGHGALLTVAAFAIHFPDGGVLTSLDGVNPTDPSQSPSQVAELLQLISEETGSSSQPQGDAVKANDDEAEREAARAAQLKGEVVRHLVDGAKLLAELAESCRLCNVMQSRYLAVHECVHTLRSMKAARLPRSRDFDISRGPSREGAATAAALPHRVWTLVAAFLPTEDLVWFPSICRSLAEESDDLVWGTLFERYFELPHAKLPVWRTAFMKIAKVATAERGVPSLSRFTAHCCPTGSVALGKERFQVIDYYPTVLCIRQRHGNIRLRLEASVIPAPQYGGSCTVVALCAAGDSNNSLRRMPPFLTSTMNAHLRASIVSTLAQRWSKKSESRM